jgi:hypothetical protein
LVLFLYIYIYSYIYIYIYCAKKSKVFVTAYRILRLGCLLPSTRASCWCVARTTAGFASCPCAVMCSAASRFRSRGRCAAPSAGSLCTATRPARRRCGLHSHIRCLLCCCVLFLISSRFDALSTVNCLFVSDYRCAEQKTLIVCVCVCVCVSKECAVCWHETRDC